MAKLVLERVSKQYESTEGYAVEDFNLEVAQKEFVVFVGPSGCGKSTVLRMIAGLEDVTLGGIFVDDQPFSKKRAAEGDIAMVFQNYALYPHMTVYDNIAYSLKIKHVDKKEIRRKVDQVAQILELEEVLDRRPNQLSGGQKQRVAMGRALIRTPKLFLMDEPLSNLDAKLRTQMRRTIQDLYRQSESTFIYVTHDQTEAMTLGTRIVVLKDGIIQQIATPEVLYDAPANQFVAGFIGSPQMNFWEAKVIQDKTKVKLQMGDLGVYLLPEDLADRLRQKSYLGREIIVGIRPENLYLKKDDGMDESGKWLSAQTQVFEMDGAVGYLHMESGSMNVTARLKGDAEYAIGHTQLFGMEEAYLHFFDMVSGEAI